MKSISTKNYLHVLRNLIVLLSLFQHAVAHERGRESDNYQIPVGLDAYRMWDKLPLQRIGVRSYMRSTYDRIGGNHTADASHYLFANEQDQNFSLDVRGKGVLYFFRANHWHGSPWHFWIDGLDNIVKETGTADPANAKKVIKDTEFIPAKPFPKPLAWTWAATKGADLIWTPMPFEEWLRIAYSRTYYGTGYYIYQLYADGLNLSHPIKKWDINAAPDQEVVALINRSGTDIAPKNIKKLTGKVILNKENIVFANIKAGSGTVRAVKFSLPLDKAIALERLKLKVTWDNAKIPSIDAPLCLFFGAGTLYNRENKEYLVKGFPISIRYDYPNQRVELSCYYPMPFFSAAKFELSGITPGSTQIIYEIRYEPLRLPVNQSSYFHATYKDLPEPEAGQDMTYLDTKGIEGHDEWSGSFVGTSFIFSHQANLATLEGDPRFFFDESESPQAYGTGTEEWAGGGDYWGGENMTLPFAGHPCGANGKNKAKHEKDLIESGYRFLIADMMPFGRRAVIRFEHGGENLAEEHYEAVTYWYGLPAPSLIKTDDLDIGNLNSEKLHHYYSPGASAPVSITSRYELGIDSFPGKINKEVYPAKTMDGRYTRGSSEFELKLDPKNQGALIRRTLDYSFPNQTAEVYIAAIDKTHPAASPKWEKAGDWYLAGSNTAIFSFPRGETDNRKIEVETSNRRFRDDEFLVPAKLTKGRAVVRVKIKFIPNEQTLYPGFPFPNQSAWSELKYHVYSYVLPNFKLNNSKHK
jgi:hypothetical protein